MKTQTVTKTALNISDSINIIHPFEKAGLGKAPFKYVGMSEKSFVDPVTGNSRSGSCCDYCATAITYEFRVRSSDGNEFKVGSDCIYKALPSNDPLTVAVKRAASKTASTKKKLSDAEKAAQIPELLTALQSQLTLEPHKNQHLASQGKTMYDYYEYMAQVSGLAGKVKVYKTLKALFKLQRNGGGEGCF